MIWWFLILGVSTLVVVCVAIALYMHLRKNLQKMHTHDTAGKELENDHPADSAGQ
jgi:hypothetical protein